MNPKKRLLESSLIEFDIEDLDELNFGDLSHLLSHHLELNLNGSWEGTRLLELTEGLAARGIEVTTSTIRTSCGNSDSIFQVRMSFHGPASLTKDPLSVFFEHKAGFSRREDRLIYGQTFGKTALYVLSLQAKILSGISVSARKGALIWHYNKPRRK